jgi:hypothetical protein
MRPLSSSPHSAQVFWTSPLLAIASFFTGFAAVWIKSLFRFMVLLWFLFFVRFSSLGFLFSLFPSFF